MLADSLQSEEKTLIATDSSYRKTSPLPTYIQTSDNSPISQAPSQYAISQKTLPETLPFNSRALDFEEHQNIHQLQDQLVGLQHRFNGIHKILIEHSEFESRLHEKKKGYKALPIDANCLCKDFTNKVHIINDITSLVDNLPEKDDEQSTDLLQTKFQEYYLQRHYGGLNGDFDTLSIQQRLDVSQQMKQEQKYIISKLGNYQSLIPQSKITYSQQFCQTQSKDYQDYQIIINIPKIIYIEIPVIAYKYNQLHPHNQQGCHNIDDIISKFSKPYEDIYQRSQWKEEGEHISITKPQTPAPSNATTSIVQASHIEQQPQQTQIELAYSDFPQEDMLKLPLDSYAQIQSLISNSSRQGTQRSRPRTQRETPLTGQAVYITQKSVSRSIIQKYEQCERALIDQNSDLKEYIQKLEQELVQTKKQRNEYEKQNNKLANRLQEQIQQTEYFSSKLEELNTQFLEENVQSLTYLNQSKERKIQIMSQELLIKNTQLEELTKQLEVIEKHLNENDQLLQRKDQEIIFLTQQTLQRQKQLNELTHCQEDVIMLASQTELGLKDEIEKLERQRSELKDNVKYYQQRLLIEGISLQVDQATEIQSIIEQREHHFSLELQDVHKKYDQILGVYQKELTDLKVQLEEEKIMYDQKNMLIDNLKDKEQSKKTQMEEYCQEFQAIVTQYNEELEAKDQEILALKKDNTGKNAQADISIQFLLEKAQKSIQFLEKQLSIERDHKSKMTKQIIQLDQLIKKQVQNHQIKKINDQQTKLIEELSIQLEKKMQQNKVLKKNVEIQSQQILQLSEKNQSGVVSELKQENIKLRKTNGKLKRYTMNLEEEIKAVCGFDQSESQKNWITLILQERDYYLGLVSDGKAVQTQIVC